MSVILDCITGFVGLSINILNDVVDFCLSRNGYNGFYNSAGELFQVNYFPIVLLVLFVPFSIFIVRYFVNKLKGGIK